MPPALASIPVPDHLLEEILLRLSAPDDLARACAACTSFRRVIKGRAFRRRFRALHRPPLLGFMDAGGFHPAQAPHPSAPLASALAPRAADFSFVPAVVSSSSYFMPPGVQDDEEGPRWRPCDVRDGRDWRSIYPRSVHMWTYRQDGCQVSILKDSREMGDNELCDRLTWTKRERCNAADFHLAVCDPLSSRYLLLPTIPEDLAAQPQECLSEFEAVLDPNTSDDYGDQQPFRFKFKFKPRDSSSSAALQKVVFILRMWIVTQWRSRLMKLPKYAQRWGIPTIPDMHSHTLASRRCYRNQLSDQLI
ncbi:hypothetical protein ZWY2020_000027 [Hordeum vulgare]|nr:hypothetical protein ZWY2020_000027 [Hordeum vulgare]